MILGFIILLILIYVAWSISGAVRIILGHCKGCQSEDNEKLHMSGPDEGPRYWHPFKPQGGNKYK